MNYIIFLVVLIFVLFGYMIKLAFENNVLHHRMTLEGKEEKIRIFFISDVHNRKINEKMLQTIEKPVHAVIIGGDFCDGRVNQSKIRKNLELLNTLGPIYFAWGNNDREVEEEILWKVFQEEHVTVVENSSFPLVNVKNLLKIAAIDDWMTGNPKIDEAFKNCSEKDQVIFISHNPSVFEYVIKEYKPRLCLGGHYHGGQIRLGPFGLMPKGYVKYMEGCLSIVSNGYGTTAIPLRFGVKPQCHIIDITFQGK